MIDIFVCCAEMLIACGDWFAMLLENTGFTPIYLGFVFVAMATGFLLKRFGSALNMGSDKAAHHIKRKGE